MRRWRWWSVTLAIVTVIAVGVGIWVLLRPPRNVILITIDTMRADRISAYGFTGHRTPNLDRLAAHGILFQNAYCDVTWTTPSMASVMTGLYAPQHGMRSSFQTLKPEATTLAEILHAQGMETAAIIASYPLHSIFGLNQGFDLYDQEFSNPLAFDESIQWGPPPPVSHNVPENNDTSAMRWFLVKTAKGRAYRPDRAVSDQAISWLRQERRAPFFLWIHYFGPHEKPTGLTGLENEAKERELQLAAYDPDVVVADTEIGRVLDTLDDLGIADHTTVVVHADHGQSLMEHDYFGHGRNLYEQTARIPLIVRAPGRGADAAVDTRIARNVDILPTILDALDVPNPIINPAGESLLKPPKAGNDTTYFETYLSATRLFADVIDATTDARLGFRRLGVRTSRWKFIINDPSPFLDRADEPVSDDLRRKYYTTELYDVVADPSETKNLNREQPEVAEELRLAVWRQQPQQETISTHMPLDDTTRERLKSLGYLAE